MLYVAEDAMSVCDLGGCREHYYPSDNGFREFREDIQQGRLKIGSVAVVVCLLGGAEVRLQRLIAKEIEALIGSFKTFAPDTHVLMTGPFPSPQDDASTLSQFTQIHAALDGRLWEEPMIQFVPLAARFGDSRGLNPRLIGPDGVTERGVFVAKRELNAAIEALVS